MDHETSKGLILEYLYGEIDEVREGELKQHIAACADCAAEVTSLRKILTLYRSAPPLSAPTHTAERALAAARFCNGQRQETCSGGAARAALTAQEKARFLFHPIWGIAAVFMVVAGILLFLPASPDQAMKKWQDEMLEQSERGSNTESQENLPVNIAPLVATEQRQDNAAAAVPKEKTADIAALAGEKMEGDALPRPAEAAAARDIKTPGAALQEKREMALSEESVAVQEATATGRGAAPEKADGTSVKAQSTGSEEAEKARGAAIPGDGEAKAMVGQSLARRHADVAEKARKPQGADEQFSAPAALLAKGQRAEDASPAKGDVSAIENGMPMQDKAANNISAEPAKGDRLQTAAAKKQLAEESFDRDSEKEEINRLAAEAKKALQAGDWARALALYEDLLARHLTAENEIQFLTAKATCEARLQKPQFAETLQRLEALAPKEAAALRREFAKALKAGEIQRMAPSGRTAKPTAPLKIKRWHPTTDDYERP